MRWRGLAFVGLLALGGCPGGFTRDEALFGAEDGVAMLGDRGALLVPGPLDRTMQYSYERHGATYEFGSEIWDGSGGLNAPLIQFIPITETPEEDYVAQVRLTAEGIQGEAIYFAFVLRTPRNSLRILGDPLEVRDEFEPSPSDALCRPNGRSNAECEFVTRADLIHYYMSYVRDRLLAECDPNECEATIVSETP